MRSVAGFALVLTLSGFMFGTAVGASPGQEDSKGTITIEEYHRRVDRALRPAFLPLVTEWVQNRYGQQATAKIRFIGLEPSGRIHVHVDAEAPNKACIFAFYFEWRSGWKLVQVDNHSASSSGCD